MKAANLFRGILKRLKFGSVGRSSSVSLEIICDANGFGKRFFLFPLFSKPFDTINCIKTQ